MKREETDRKEMVPQCLTSRSASFRDRLSVSLVGTVLSTIVVVIATPCVVWYVWPLDIVDLAPIALMFLSLLAGAILSAQEFIHYKEIDLVCRAMMRDQEGTTLLQKGGELERLIEALESAQWNLGKMAHRFKTGVGGAETHIEALALLVQNQLEAYSEEKRELAERQEAFYNRLADKLKVPEENRMDFFVHEKPSCVGGFMPF